MCTRRLAFLQPRSSSPLPPLLSTIPAFLDLGLEKLDRVTQRRPEKKSMRVTILSPPVPVSFDTTKRPDQVLFFPTKSNQLSFHSEHARRFECRKRRPRLAERTFRSPPASFDLYSHLRRSCRAVGAPAHRVVPCAYRNRLGAARGTKHCWASARNGGSRGSTFPRAVVPRLRQRVVARGGEGGTT